MLTKEDESRRYEQLPDSCRSRQVFNLLQGTGFFASNQAALALITEYEAEAAPSAAPGR